MSKVLYIKANTTSPEKSRTFRISDYFVEEYKRVNPNDEVITLDLYKEDIKLPTENEVNSLMIPKTEESRNNPILKYAYQFAEADKYIVAEPMWNLCIPARESFGNPLFFKFTGKVLVAHLREPSP